MRRSHIVTVKHGRDKGRHFQITEMSAFDCEGWARNAVSEAYRCALASDAPLLQTLAGGFRDFFEAPEVEPIKLPSDGSLTADDPIIKQAQKERAQAAEEACEQKREQSPMQLVASIGLQLFYRLPRASQSAILNELMACVSVKVGEAYLPIMELRDTGWTLTEQAADEYVTDPLTVRLLQREAFAIHADFFTAAVPYIYQAVRARLSLYP